MDLNSVIKKMDSGAKKFEFYSIKLLMLLMHIIICHKLCHITGLPRMVTVL